MAYLQTVSESEATGEVAELYAADRAQHGHVKNLTRAFSPRPEVFRAWVGLNTSIKQAMGLRRYEMATLGAARRLQSSYCMLAHGRTVARELLDEDSLVQLVDGASTDGLDAVDLAVMRLADKVAAGGVAVTADDLAELRALGLSDTDLLDVVLAAAARCFFSTVLDATGTLPDSAYRDDFAPLTLAALTVGRPIADPG
jgi:uncharacterized peroxidase-related enzyme